MNDTPLRLPPIEWLSFVPRVAQGVLDADQVASILAAYDLYEQDTGEKYGDLARVFSPYLYLQDRFSFLNAICERIKRDHLPDGYGVFHDELLWLGYKGEGSPWHTANETITPTEGHPPLITAWIALTDVSEATGGRVLALRNPLVSYGLQQWFRGLNENFDEYNRDDDEKKSNWAAWNQLVIRYFENNSAASNTAPGDAFLFADTTWHRSEEIHKEGYRRYSYVIRFMPLTTRFNLEATKRELDSLGHHCYRVICEHQTETLADYIEVVNRDRSAVVASHPALLSR